MATREQLERQRAAAWRQYLLAKGRAETWLEKVREYDEQIVAASTAKKK